jgi:hypothetical protein
MLGLGFRVYGQFVHDRNDCVVFLACGVVTGFLLPFFFVFMKSTELDVRNHFQ